MKASPEIVLLCPAITARMKYISRFVSARLKCKIQLIHSGQFQPKSGSDPVILNYGPAPIARALNIFSGGLMFKTGIEKQDTGYFRKECQAYLYPAPEGFDLPFDLFSACFFLLSRYEEYLPFEPDQYGRFEADQSLAYRSGFLEEPVIDQWLHLFKKILLKKFPGLDLPPQRLHFISTFDIDNPWAFRNKGLIRNAAGGLKALLRGQIPDVRQRLSVLFGKRQDPFDNYDYILDMEKKYRFTSKFFFLFGNYDRRDSNYTLNTLQFKSLVQQIGRNHPVGIHPSLRSNDHAALLKAEYKRYSGILGKAPAISRQHFLILRFPETYRRLIETGIKEDYSIGYASNPGFRAGTCSPFNFYDLAAENETALILNPFVVMDVTFRQYLLLTPNEALDRIKRLIAHADAVGGTFVSLWHNESLSGEGIWKGWREVFERMVEEVRSRER